MAELKRYTEQEPILLFSDFPPCAGGGGATNLRSLLQDDLRRRVVWVTLATGEGSANAPVEYEGFRVVHARGGPSRTAPRGKRSLLVDTLKSKPLAEEINEIADKVGARAIWIVMHGATVPVAARLSTSSSKPVHLTVNDDPTGVALQSKRMFLLYPYIASRFARAMKAAASIDVVSRGMQTRYLERYGVETTIVNRGLPPRVTTDSPYQAHRSVLRVGVLGSNYSYQQLPILGQAVGDAARRGGVQGELVVIGQALHGQRLQKDLMGTVSVTLTGHLPEHEAIERLRTCFLLYLNYPFDWRNRIFRQTSLPVKTCTYIRAGRPLLLHCPSDSSIYPFTEQRPYVTHWPDMYVATGADVIADCWNDEQLHASFVHEAEMLRIKYFDLELHQETLFRMLDALVAKNGEELSTAAELEQASP